MTQKTLMDWLHERNKPTIKFLIDKTLKYSDNKNWYRNSYETIKELFGNDTELFIKILASTSQQNSVQANAQYAIEAYELIKNGASIEGLMCGIAQWKIIENLNLARQNRELDGNKINTFAHALMNDPECIVIDRWIMRAFNLNRIAPTQKDRQYIQDIVKIISDNIGFTPAETQACLWAYAKSELSDKEQYKDYSDYSVYIKQYKNNNIIVGE
jgi:hypothetical protein